MYATHERQLIVIRRNITVGRQRNFLPNVNPKHHPIIFMAEEADEMMISQKVVCHSGKMIHVNVFQMPTLKWSLRKSLAEPMVAERFVITNVKYQSHNNITF